MVHWGLPENFELPLCKPQLVAWVWNRTAADGGSISEVYLEITIPFSATRCGKKSAYTAFKDFFFSWTRGEKILLI